MSRRRPEGGLSELRQKHMAGWEYFDALVHLAQAGARLSKSQVAYGMRYVVASLWALADNARPMAVEKLRLAGQSTSASTSVCFSSCSSTTAPPPMCVIKLLHCHHLFYLCVFMLGSSTACLPACLSD